MSIKVGIVGAGAIGEVHAKSAKKAGATVVAIADVNGEAAERFGKEHAVDKRTGDIDELFQDSDIDAIVVAVPNCFHRSVAISAMEAGKDVFLEKPMALSAVECREIDQVARRQDRILQIGFVNRYTPHAMTAKRFVDDGRIGKVYHAKANFYRRRGIPGLGGWFTTKAMSGGGPLIDIGVHVMDLAMHLMGYPKPLRASGKVYAQFGPRMGDYLYEKMWAGPPKQEGTFDVEDSAHALIRLDGGATLEVNVTWAGNFKEEGPFKNSIALLGDKGGLSFNLYEGGLSVTTEENGHNVDLTPHSKESDAWENQWQAFIHAVKTREQPEASGANGTTVQAMIDAIYSSGEADAEVSVDV